MSNRIVELVNLWAQYEAESPDLSIEDFCIRYLLEAEAEAHHPSDALGIPLDGQILALLGRLNKYAGHYSKKALKSVDLNNQEDWLYLIALVDGKTPKKSELIHEMLSEFPTGIEVINRLLKAGLITQFPDPEDKRSKRIKISREGMQVLAESLDSMNDLGRMAFDQLTGLQKSMLLKLLKQLDEHHYRHYRTVKDLDFAETFRLLVADHQ
jgi:DNA-binding MarR family transcriptional regulator